MIIDTHTHSHYSPDASSDLKDMIQSAVNKGVDVYGITDHCDIIKFDEVDYFKLMTECANEVKEIQKTTPIKLLTGLELGEPTIDLSLADKIISSYDFDCIIGSLHAVTGQKDFYWSEYDKMTDDDINNLLSMYYDEVLKLVEWNGQDILAHLTYPYRYIINHGRLKGDVSYKIFDEQAKKIFKRLIEADKAFENNTASSGKSQLDFEANLYFLKLYKASGGKRISIGSDAHDVKRVGDGIARDYKMLKELGFETVTYYENRKPVEVKI